MWTLQSTDPADLGLLFRLLPPSIKTMGRAPGTAFVVDAALVSRIHCRFTLGADGALLLDDLGSTNGTLVNGERVTRRQLAAGDTVQVGRVTFLVAQPARAEA